MTNPFDSDEWRDYARRVQEELVPKIAASALSLTLWPGGMPDVKIAVELGMSLLLDKPLILLVPHDVELADRLYLVADQVIRYDPANLEASGENIANAVARITTNLDRPS